MSDNEAGEVVQQQRSVFAKKPPLTVQLFCFQLVPVSHAIFFVARRPGSHLRSCHQDAAH